jgi:hypothetical protein
MGMGISTTIYLPVIRVDCALFGIILIISTLPIINNQVMRCGMQAVICCVLVILFQPKYSFKG